MSRRSPPHLLPPPGEQGWGWGVALHYRELTLPSQRPCCLPRAFLGKGVSVIFCTQTSSVCSALLAAPPQNYLNGNQSALDSGSFSFHVALGEEESRFAKRP